MTPLPLPLDYNRSPISLPYFRFTNQRIMFSLPLQFLHNYFSFGYQVFKSARLRGLFDHLNQTGHN